MKGIAVLAVVGVIALGLVMFNPSTSDDMEQMYSQYLSEYGKNYNNVDEYEMRLQIFSDNVRFINEENARQSDYELGINQFSDWTNEEYRRLLGYRPVQTEDVEEFVYDGPVANAIDWVSKGFTIPVQNQGNCGSCWAFGTTGAVEGALFASTGKLTKFAEQELVDCCHDSCYGCNGGFQDKAIDWLKGHAFCLEKDYKYTGRDGSCKSSQCSGSVQVSGRSKVGRSSSALQGALNKAPVSVTVDAGSSVFQSYRSGILSSSSCGTSLNHAVLGVGYGTENGVDFFKIKNSWGSGWGDKGYIRIKATSGSKGLCGIYMDNDLVKH